MPNPGTSAKAYDTKRGTQEHMHRSALIVTKEGHPLREVAKRFDICHMSLFRYCRKLTEFQHGLVSSPPRTGYNPHTRVFSAALEDKLVNYLLQASDIYYGLTPRQVRCFAFKRAVTDELKMPESLRKKEIAGVDCFSDNQNCP